MIEEFPAVIEMTKDDSGVVLTLHFNKQLKYFEGHFEHFAILPGVVQIHWAILFAKKYLDVSGKFSGLDAVKFAAPILPETRLQLRLSFDLRSEKLKFEYFQHEKKYSSGKIVLASEPHAV